MLLRSIKGLFLLIRIIPVLSWSFSAILLSIGFALHDLQTFSNRHWLIIMVLFLGTLSLQGIVAHAFNDRTDWRSNTDRYSKGVLSGGSKVIPKGYMTERQLLITGLIGILFAGVLGWYLSSETSKYVWIFVSVGIWSAISYTSYPFRFSYVPFLGEWIAAFPAMVACTLGTYYELTGSISLPVFWAGIIHSLLCVSWLMQHHLSDIDSDLLATPKKLTTVALFAERWGKETSRHVVSVYFLLATFVSIIATLSVHHLFLVSVISSLIGAVLAWNTNPYNIANITFNQVRMILVTIVHSIILFGFEILS